MPALLLRPALVSFTTCLLVLFTSALSISLTYSWQSKWRDIKRPAFISDAHYDERQSPIFVSTTTVTAVSIALIVLLTYGVTKRRRLQTHHSIAPGVNDVQHECRRFFRVPPRMYPFASLVALLLGVLGSFLLAVAAAVNTKNSFHYIAISLSFGTITLWAILVSLTLESTSGSLVEDHVQRSCTFGMQFCSIMMLISSVSMVHLFSRNLVAAAFAEYMIVGFGAVFFLFLSCKLQGSKLILEFVETEQPTLQDAET